MARYEAYPTPVRFVGRGGGGGSSIADLIMQSGRDRADAEMRGAQGWSDAIGNISNLVTNGVQQYQQKRDDKSVQDAVMASMGGGGLRSALPAKIKPDLDVNGDPSAAAGAGGPDIASILGSIKDPAVRARAMKGIQDMQTTQGKFQEQNLQVQKLQGELKDAETKRQQAAADHWGTTGLNLEQHLQDEDGGITAANYAVDFSKSMPGADRLAPFARQAKQAYEEAVATGDKMQATMVADAFRKQVQPLIDQGKSTMSPDALKAYVEARNAAKPKTREIEIVNQDGSTTKKIVEDTPNQTFQSAKKPETPGSEADFIRRQYGANPTPEQILAGREKYGAAGREPDVAMSLTPAALKQAAQLFLDTGSMPPAGMGKQGTAMRQAILNEAARMSPDANVAENKATFQADKGSLTKLQAQTDAVAAFESTAEKNSKILDETLSKIPDSGTKLLNRPLRSLAGVAGSEDIAKFNTIRQSVQNEYARIISNPTLAGQMSDSARKEGEAILSGDLTVGQLRAAIKVLQQEAKNRHTSYDEQIKAIKGRRHPAAASDADPLGILK